MSKKDVAIRIPAFHAIETIKDTFFEFMNKVKTEPYGGKEEFDTLREKLPKWVIDLDKKSGVLGDEGYVYTIDEKNEK